MSLKLISSYSKEISVSLFFSFFVLISFSMLSNASEVLDKSFLKEQPFRKGKQTVDLTNISNTHDLFVVKSSINNVMRLLTILGYVELNNPGLSSVVTTNGVVNLRYPPVNTKSNRMIFSKVWNWKVINDSELSFDVEFIDSKGKKAPYFDHFVFVKTEQGWLFDHH